MNITELTQEVKKDCSYHLFGILDDVAPAVPTERVKNLAYFSTNQMSLQDNR